MLSRRRLRIRLRCPSHPIARPLHTATATVTAPPTAIPLSAPFPTPQPSSSPHQSRKLLTSFACVDALHRRPSQQSRYGLCNAVSSRSFSGGASPKPESLEEMAKRLSDEADAEFRASGRKSSVSARMKRSPAQPTPDTASTPSFDPSTDATSQSTSSSTSSSSTSSDASTSSSASSSSSPPSEDPRSPSTRSSFLRSLTNEWSHLQSFFSRWKRAPSINRSKRTAAEVLTKPTILPKKQTIPNSASLDDLPPDAPTDSNPPSPSTDLVLVDSSTVWDRRLERMRHSFHSSAPFLRFRKARRTLIHSQNPILKPIQAMASVVGETLDDMKLTWETSQHPLLFKVRDVTDKVVGETEMGFALGEIMKVDPSFDLLSFQQEMEEYQIPVIITAYLRGSPSDQRLLAQCTEGPAATLMRSSFLERLNGGEEWDHRILDISHVELQNAVMMKDLPVLLVAFMVQQINCVRKVKGFTAPMKAGQGAAGGSGAAGKVEGGKKEGKVGEEGATPVSAKRYDSEGREIVSGFESDISNVYYHWVLRRDFENPDFDWKLMEMTSQRIASLGV